MSEGVPVATEESTAEGGITDYDVVIIGAGVNGAGLFRDLCLQGVRCLIVDKADFGSGTSAAPSRLIHGGIKYLETGELGLVAQSTLERNLLLRNAPHCVEPLATFIPSFSLMKGAFAALRTLAGSTTAPRSRGALLIKIGLALYDIYGARHRVMPKHRFFFRKAALKEMPEITPRIVAGGLYYDARISRPERLVLELITDGLQANPQSAAFNYTELTECVGDTLTFKDERNRTIRAKPTIVVNAAGPWIDRVNGALGETTRMIGGTKGSHILLDHPQLIESLQGRMIYFEADDGRICLVYDHLGKALVGSTDIKSDDPDSVSCEDDEIDYFIASLRSLLPRLRFDRNQIIYTYSGVRPLPASDASQPGLISRDHSAPVLQPNDRRPFPILSLIGGKWTTFRGFAAEVADTLLRRLGRERHIDTTMSAIGGGRDFPTTPQARQGWISARQLTGGLSAVELDRMLARYGTTADRLIAHIDNADGAVSDGVIVDIPGYRRAEIDWICRSERVSHLSDIVMRRTSLAIEGLLTGAALEDIATVAAAALGWSETRRATEIASTKHRLEGMHGVRL
ncbi:glycerol-3-phosphate dehydrogenase/oxidase [Rhizobium halophytocola]|uniref:Glycerol-3-phosphate dehydrogenase n=1 Tax=Rhizobium halophytocola TaxID=735519 RepID=A0ABS4E0S3_9HYPH|nr:glycerol-3-phosphate dehydrogenase/oxidase [Rhizobium halophytocola]MBP1851538.1 glycerol-3-phosphate dehydrogenase [Rhizobium halophytocola]